MKLAHGSQIYLEEKQLFQKSWAEARRLSRINGSQSLVIQKPESAFFAFMPSRVWEETMMSLWTHFSMI